MNRRSWILAILVILVPALAGVMVVTAATSGTAQAASVPAAVVNLDGTGATTSDGTALPAGRLLVGRLTNPDEALTEKSSTGATTSTLDYSVVDEDAAKKGLEDGTYDVVVTIPKGFSEAIVKTLDGTPTQASVQVQTNDAGSSSIGSVSSDIVSAAADSLGTTVSVAYLNGSLTAMTTLHDKLGEASDGATALASGAAALDDGIDSADDGAQQLSTGADSLADGLAQLESGAATLSSGTSTADSGANTLATGASTLASGAQTAASGVSRLDSGAAQLDSGASALATGASTLSDGVSSYAGGVAQARDGLTTVQPGQTQSLDDGAAALAQGVSQYTGGVQTVYDGMTQPQTKDGTSLVDGADAVADGLEQLDAATSTVDTTKLAKAATAASDLSAFLGDAQQVQQAASALCQDAANDANLAAACKALDDALAGSDVQNQVKTASTDLSTAATQMQALTELLQKNPTTGTSTMNDLATGARSVSNGVNQVSSGIKTNLLGSNATQLNNGAAAISKGLGTASDVYDPSTGTGRTETGVLNYLVAQNSTLTSGASQLSSGASTLSTGASSLHSGTSQLVTGASALSTGATSLSAGASSLADGLDRLATGASTLATSTGTAAGGATTLSDGASTLADGTGKLADGSSELKDGTQTLSDGLSSAKDKVPSYTDEEASALATALAQPVDVSTDESGEASTATSIAPNAIAVALWIGALVIVSGLGLMSRRRVEAPMSPARLAAASLKPALVLAAVQALALVAIVAFAGAHVNGVWKVLLLSVVAALSMTVLHAALVAALGSRGGTAVSLLALVLQAACLFATTVPQSLTGLYSTANGFMPVTVLASALRGVMLGASGVVTPASAVVTLVVWGAGSALAMTLSVRRRRATSLAGLRHDLAAA
ncbi:YhgE/Pip domain-containing protein [Actinomyces radicidentis]|uniref:YhgE/Pip domain-containing protein n=1 Tax=Actinomyces radicidentis TaxID=111015 RepID=UPI0026E0D572|nr:YhgE/Pip domain-containing protein [Actinomyces radicidentis]